ncbi:hypothetical protein KFZ70_14545 [Tamlana fucoidanivorans]|uniref:Uncharacterized protein n=1 Tax=Allotamlana fucoidanivorans TaxID=2583814 RepID=A0A5C4SGF1_9FLAO|nr:hypothetical protein [Tamlana fucoidanivorans]TNJ42398.1 hypothetical protein FGF67_14080 [Tamlana fucoidanivorans]
MKSHQNTFKTINHEVVIKHPGEEDSVRAILTERQNEAGLPVGYSMNVFSVICLEEVCKIIPVKLFWNNIGVYERYELEAGKTLEKYEADLFEPQDYEKLNYILADDNSPFKDVYYDDILTAPDEHGEEGVDALSGATALELDDKDTVRGAALTCFTLWHWANGEVVSIIKNQTGKSVSLEQLKMFILNENNTYFHIALKELINRNIYSKEVLNTVIKKVLKTPSLTNSAFKYVDKALQENYFYAVNRLFFEGGKIHRLAAIKSLVDTDYSIEKAYLDNFGKQLTQVDSYQEVAALLDLLELKNKNSASVIETAIQLLDEDFLKARKAYWVLKTKSLTPTQQARVDKFYEKYQSRL